MMKHPLLKAATINNLPENVQVHQFNEKAVRHTRSLGDLLGLSRSGIHLVRVEPGFETTQFHFHHHDEEFIYILSGRGIAEIGDEQFEIGPGDFMAFVQGSFPHAMRNPFDTDLTYLMGGNRNDIDICDYPRINRRMYRVNGVKTFVNLDDVHDV